jgi:hypothetical protein
MNTPTSPTLRGLLVQSLWLFVPSAIFMALFLVFGPFLVGHFFFRHHAFILVVCGLTIIWTIAAFFATFGQAIVMQVWWWIAVPFSVLGLSIVAISGGRYSWHTDPILSISLTLTAYFSVAWTVLSMGMMAAWRTAPRTKKHWLMLVVGVLFSAAFIVSSIHFD